MKEMNRALLACANGEWESASGILKELVEKEPDNFIVRVHILSIVYGRKDFVYGRY